MSRLTRWMDRRFYPSDGDQWDNRRFRELILKAVRLDSVVLDYGAGRGALQEMDLTAEVKKVVGVDPDEAVLGNPRLHEARVLPLPSGEIPYPDESFDLVVSNNVIEHLPHPARTFSEIWRVLRPGGRLLAKTPNRLHYISLVASATPHGFHQFYNRLRGRSREDTFPTFYRCNRAAHLRRAGRTAGFTPVRIKHWEGRPEYLRMVAPLYLLGVLYERVVNSTELLASFRCVLVADMQKPQREP